MILAIYSIYCNDCGTFERIPGHDAESPAEIVDYVRGIGWRTSKRGKQARCPDCQVKAKAMREPGRVLPPMRLDDLERECRESRDAGTAVAGHVDSSSDGGRP